MNGYGNGRPPVHHAEPGFTVTKIGGAMLDDAEERSRLCDHVAARVADGERMVLVHGGGPRISALHDALDEPRDAWEGLRVTSERGMEITTMVLCGLVNKTLVADLLARGVRAIGLSGIDLGLLRADLLDPERLGRVGGPPEVNVDAIARWTDGLVPVIAPVSLGPDGRPVNVNADTAARALAAALGARCLDFVTDVPGVRGERSGDDPIRRLCATEADDLLRHPSAVGGGMRPKLRSAIAAVRGGVDRVRVGNLGSLRSGTATEVVA
jgi:acetylglutamate kinase